MRIRRKFLQLTKWTFPYGTEFTIESHLPKGFKRDENENYYLIIGDNPTTMFACHLDTACSKQERVTHVQNSQFIMTNGKTILGADDKAGMTVILHMIDKKVPGLYYFFVGEEVGCIGSGELAEQWCNLQMFNNIKKVISFDRRDTNSVITHQLYGRCCSDEFAKELSKRFNESGEDMSMTPDDTGIMTDSAKFTDLVPECTNISVGYYNEHTVDEYQDIEFLQRLCRSVVKIDWETLPVKRDPTVDEDEDDGEIVSWNKCGDNNYEFSESHFTYVKWGTGVRRMLVSKKRIADEKSLIYEWVFRQGLYSGMTGVVWNGNSLYLENDRNYLEFIGNRTDMMLMIPELASIPTKHLSMTPKKEKKSDESTGFLQSGREYQREFLM
jgi:hypothetical protein